MPKAAILLLSALLLAACDGPSASSRVEESQNGATTGLRVVGAWCRATPNRAVTGGCFAELKATGGADRLVSVTSPLAEKGEIHAVSTEGGVMRMTPLADGLPLPDGQTVRLAPGGDHIMLVGLKGPLVDGETAPMTLTFESGRTMTLDVPIRRAPQP